MGTKTMLQLQAAGKVATTLSATDLLLAGIDPAGVFDNKVIEAEDLIATLLELLSATRGTILYRGASGWVALAPSTSGYFLKTLGAGADPAWAAIPLPADLAIASQAQGDILYFNGTNWVRLAAGTSGKYLKTLGAGANPIWDTTHPAGYLFGLTLSNNGSDATNDIDIAAGKCRDSTDVIDMVLASALTKRLDAAWAVGTNQGGLDTGSIADTTYHIWLIKRSDTGVVDALFSTSASAPTMPANYDYKRRIGSIVRASAAIVGFVQDGDKFALKVPTKISASNEPTTAQLKTLTNVPAGIRVEAEIYASIVDASPAGTTFWLITDPSQTDTAPGAGTVWTTYSTTSAVISFIYTRTFTNTSAQIRSRLSDQQADITIYLTVNGWIDTRGRLA